MNDCNRQHEVQLETLHEVTQVLAQKSGQRKMLQDILNTLETRLDVPNAPLMLLSPSENELIVEALLKENERLKNQLKEKFRPEHIIGDSDAMQEVFTKIHQVSGRSTAVLIRGESGTGKELVAAAVHFSDPNSQNKPFIKVNCAALSEHLLESELFGHEKGAFTGAYQTRIGRLEEAEGGTLFLDEIGDFSLAIQVKLLRVLQEKEFQRIGSNKSHKANLRIIAATNKDLEEAVRLGQFRQDLYCRINVFPILLPPLRKRKSDILLLANEFVKSFSHRMGKRIHRISTPAINMLTAYHWPGNVRELENCIEHAVLVSDDGVIHGRNLPPTLQVPDDSIEDIPGTLHACTAILESDMIVDALKRSKGNMSAAARELGITSRMIRYKIKNLRIDYNKLFDKTRGIR
jgi:Nif-specific regulatory protein